MKQKITLIALTLTLLLSFCIPSFAGCSDGKELISNQTFEFFDTVCDFSFYAKNAEEFDILWDKIRKELEKYHKMFDIYNSYDGMVNAYTLNHTAKDENGDRICKVPKEMFELISYCKKIYDLSKGKLNIASGSLLSLWHEARENANNSPEKAKLPEFEELKEASLHCDFNDVILNEQNLTVTVKDEKLLFDFGSVAKGFAAKKVLEMLEKEKVSGFILNLGGAVSTCGTKPHGGEFIAGIESENLSSYIRTLKIKDVSLVTSGSYQRYFLYDGEKYCHIIDMDTLYPANIYTSVSVLTKDPLFADIMSTLLFTLHESEAFEFIENAKKSGLCQYLEVLFAEENGTITQTPNFPKDEIKR